MWGSQNRTVEIHRKLCRENFGRMQLYYPRGGKLVPNAYRVVRESERIMFHHAWNVSKGRPPQYTPISRLKLASFACLFRTFPGIVCWHALNRMFSAFLLLYAFLDDQQLYPCHSHSIDFMTGYIWLHLISPQRECRFSPKPYGFLFPTWTCSDFHNIHTNDCNPSITEEMISGIGERSTCRDDFCLRVHLMMLVHLGFIIKSFSVISSNRLDRRMDRLFFASSARPILDHQTKPKKQPWDRTMWN